MQVFDLWGVVSGFVKRQLGQLAVGNGDIETIAKGTNVVVGQLFGLVNRILALASLAHAKAFHGLDQQYRGLPLVLSGGVVRGIDLLRVMTAATQIPDVVVAHVRHHLQSARIATKEMLANIGTVIGLESLVVTVHGVHHDLAQSAVFIAGQQRVPIAAPDELEHIPTRTTELALELLNDLAIAANRTVESLQIAVDDKNQVIQVLSGSQAYGPHRFDFVHFAVAAKHPNLSVFGIGNASGVQVLQKTRLINSH